VGWRKALFWMRIGCWCLAGDPHAVLGCYSSLLRWDGSGASSLLRRDGSGVQAKRQQSSGETAEDFQRSRELCQTATIGAHDEVVEAIFMCVSMGPARKVLVGLPARKVWVRGGEIRLTRVEIVWDSVLGLVPASAWAYHLPLCGPTTCLCVLGITRLIIEHHQKNLYQVRCTEIQLPASGSCCQGKTIMFKCHILTYLEVCPQCYEELLNWTSCFLWI
jgi:hypothetical protein